MLMECIQRVKSDQTLMHNVPGLFVNDLYHTLSLSIFPSPLHTADQGSRLVLALKRSSQGTGQPTPTFKALAALVRRPAGHTVICASIMLFVVCFSIHEHSCTLINRLFFFVEFLLMLMNVDMIMLITW